MATQLSLHSFPIEIKEELLILGYTNDNVA